MRVLDVAVTTLAGLVAEARLDGDLAEPVTRVHASPCAWTAGLRALTDALESVNDHEDVTLRLNVLPAGVAAPRDRDSIAAAGSLLRSAVLARAGLTRLDLPDRFGHAGLPSRRSTLTALTHAQSEALQRHECAQVVG